MFSGIVETRARILKATRHAGLVRIEVERPNEFTDITTGDSLAVDGVCLTVENPAENGLVPISEPLRFALGAETLQVTGWTAEGLTGREVNLERSLRFGDRVHGHLVSGHVDGIGQVESAENLGGSVLVKIRPPRELMPYLWRKGSWAVNGVSLTLNDVRTDIAEVCLIPETMSRTNLGGLRAGDTVTLEADMMARAWVARALEMQPRTIQS